MGLVAGAAVAVVPYVYYWRHDWQQLQTTGAEYAAVLLGPVAAAGFVAAVLAHRRPRWWLGALLGFVLAAVTAVFFLRVAGEAPDEWWALALLGILMAVTGGLAGAFGGALGSLVSRALASGMASADPSGTASGVRSWHLGAAVATVMVVVFGLLAALA